MPPPGLHFTFLLVVLEMETRILFKLGISFANREHPWLLCLLCRFQGLNSGRQACSACGISQDQCFVPYRCSRHPPFGDSHTTPLFLGVKNHCLPPGKYEGTGWRFAGFCRLSRRDLLSSDPYLFVENWSHSHLRYKGSRDCSTGRV